MNPTVSIVIPTKNSETTIESCILSIKKQTYSGIEIIVVDSNSTDNTVQISTEMQCNVISTNWKLLGARYKGIETTTAKYILMLDSDQLLEEDTIEKCILLVQRYDMLCLGETTHRPKTIIQKLFEADRRLINKEVGIQIDPVRGTSLARFYKRDILERAFRSIPESLLPSVIAHDHAIIYYEAWKLSNKVGFLPQAVRHNEPATLKELWIKNFRYGRSTRFLLGTGYYNNFIRNKTHMRVTRSGISEDRLLSVMLLMLKAPAYLLGLYL